LLPQLADEFVNIGLDFITISVDGSAEVHDSVRGRKGSFAKLYHGVEKLIQAKLRKKMTKPGIQFSYTLTDENYTDLVNFVQQVAALKIDSLVFSHLNFITHEMAEVHNTFYNQELSVVRSNLGEMNLNSLNLQAMWKTLQELKAHPYVNSARPTLTIIPDFTEFKDLQVYYRQPLSFVGGSHCTDPWRMMMIKTDGTVIPAHGRCYNFPVGKITETSLKDIWNSSRFMKFRTTLKEAGGTLPACARCCGVIGKPKEQV
ncbi:MAG: SPASM domain-containing protein, partial [bacterium]